MRYKAFISYSHADIHWASWLQKSLERYRIPQKLVKEYKLSGNRLNPIFLDRDELSSSSSLSDSIREALKSSDNLIVICSPSSVASRWVNEEIKTFRELGKGKQIFCLIVDGVDGEFFPAELQENEPLGADVRPRADGKHNAKLKLIASLTNIPFSSLKDREQRRRTRFFAVTSTTAIILAGVMTVLAINAVKSKREAEHHRNLATIALHDAETVSQFLAKMLVEIDPEAMGKMVVEEIGGSEVLPALAEGFNSTDLARRLLDTHILNKAASAVRIQFVEQPAIGARLNLALGASYQSLGLFDKAIERNQAAVKLYEDQFGDQDERTINAKTNLGLSYLYEGRLDDSVSILENSVETSLRSLGHQHEKTLMAKNGLAMAYMDVERLQEALTLLEEVTAAFTARTGLQDETNLEVKANLAWTLYLLGDYQRSETLTTELYEQRLATLGEENPLTLTLLNNLALIYARTDRLVLAEQAHSKEWQIAQRTMGIDHPEVLISMLNLGRIKYRLAKYQEASTLLNDARERARRVLPPVHPLTAAILLTNGEVKLKLNDKDQALKLFLEVKDIYQQLFEPDHPRFEGLNSLMDQAQSLDDDADNKQ